MLWVLLSVVSGLGDAVMYASMKKADKVNDLLIVWVQFAFALPFLLLALYFAFPQRIDSTVYWLGLLNALLLSAATWLLVKATKASKLSKAAPLLSLTPLFLVMTSYLMVKEIPDFSGSLGIVLIVVGAYIVNLKSLSDGIFAPFRSLLNNTSSRYLLIVAFLFSVLANLFKIGISYSNPVFFSALVYGFAALGLTPFVFAKERDIGKQIKGSFPVLFTLGIASAAMMITSSYSMIYAIVPYAISLKRSSVIFAIFLGYYIFGERNIRNALIGASIMLIGGLLIML